MHNSKKKTPVTFKSTSTATHAHNAQQHRQIAAQSVHDFKMIENVHQKLVHLKDTQSISIWFTACSVTLQSSPEGLPTHTKIQKNISRTIESVLWNRKKEIRSVLLLLNCIATHPKPIRSGLGHFERGLRALNKHVAKTMDRSEFEYLTNLCNSKFEFEHRYILLWKLTLVR